MFYLLTDQDNKTWKNIQWEENLTHTESNTNYYFEVFKSPLLASYLAPRYVNQFDQMNPKIWLAKGEGDHIDWGFTVQFEKLTTIKDIGFRFPTSENRRIMAILAAMNLIDNSIFSDWAISYLIGKDTSLETAEKTYSQIRAYIDASEEQNAFAQFATIHGIFAGFIKENPDYFNACAIYKAHYDATDRNLNINLEELARITYELPPEEIVAMFV